MKKSMLAVMLFVAGGCSVGPDREDAGQREGTVDSNVLCETIRRHKAHPVQRCQPITVTGQAQAPEG